MKIITKSKEFSKQEMYLLTKSPSMETVNTISDGATLTVLGYLTFTDVNSRGEESEILSILGENGQVWCCQSLTFKRNFYDLFEIFGDEQFTIKKISGTTKAGKSYVNCDLYI